MLHLIQTLDGHTTRCGHEIDGSLRVQTTGLQQFYGSLHRLHHDLLGIVGLETEFHTTFTCGTDITHGVSDTTTGEGSTCCQMLLVGDERMTHLVEDPHNGLRLCLRSSHRHDEGHRGHLGNGDIRDCQEQRRALFPEPLLDALRLHTGCNHNQDLLLGIQFGFDVLQHALHQPGLHDHAHDVGRLSSQLVVCRHTDTCLCKLIHHSL